MTIPWLRLFGTFLFLVIFATCSTCVWYWMQRENLEELADAYTERQEYEARLQELQHSIRELIEERSELARGGFPAEKALREQLYYARPDEFVFRIDPQAESLSDVRRRLTNTP